MIKEKLKVIAKSNPISICLLLFIFHFSFLTCQMPESSVRSPSYNPELIGWRPASMTPFSVNDTINDFAYGKIGGNDCYVAVSSSGTIAWSDDGDIWQRAGRMVECERTIGFDKCGEIIYVGLHDTSYTCSFPDEDGNPVSVILTPAGPINTVTFGNGIFVAAGNRGFIAVSENGKSWKIEQKTLLGGNDGVMRGIAFGDGVFIAVGSSNNKGLICYSHDSVNWMPGASFSVEYSKLNDIAFDSVNNTFYAVGNYGYWGTIPSGSLGTFTSPIGSIFGTSGVPEMRKVVIGNNGSAVIGMIMDRNIGNDRWFRRPVVLHTLEASAGWNRTCGDPDCQEEYCQSRVLWKPELFKNPRGDGNININDIACGGGYFVAVADAAVVGYVSGSPAYGFSGHKNALVGGGDRFWNALALTEFLETDIMTVEALNGRFFIGNNTGKIGYSK